MTKLTESFKKSLFFPLFSIIFAKAITHMDMKKALFIVANKNFRDEEFAEPKRVLEQDGVEITVAAGQNGMCIGRFGLEIEANMSIQEARAEEYDVIVFIGGNGAYEEYKDDDVYLQLAKDAKLLAAICIAPTIIADSGIFKGKRVTGWDDGNGTQKRYIELKGGIFIEEDVVVDGNIITANGPHVAEVFGQAIVSQLLER